MKKVFSRMGIFALTILFLENMAILEPQARASQFGETELTQSVIEISTPQTLQFPESSVNFQVTIHSPQVRAKNVKYVINAYYPDLNHPVTLSPGSGSNQYTFSSGVLNQGASNSLTVQVLRQMKHGKKISQTLVAEQSVPVFLVGQISPPAENFDLFKEKLSGKIELTPGAVYRGGETLAVFEANSSDSDIELVASLDNQELKRVHAHRGLNQFSVLVKNLNPENANLVKLSFRKVDRDDNRDRDKNRDKDSVLASVELEIRVANDSPVDPRFPQILCSELSPLFTKYYPSGMSTSTFLAQWQSPQIQMLASFYLECQGNTVAPPIPGPQPSLPLPFKLIDLGCDGKKALALVNSDQNSISVMPLESDGTYGTPVIYSVGTRPVALGISDLNHDNRNDIVVVNSGSADVTVLLANPAACGSFYVKETDAVGIDPVSVVIEDLNLDQNQDLIVANYGSSSLSILLGRGDGTFYLQSSIALADPPLQIEPHTGPSGDPGVTTDSGNTGIVPYIYIKNTFQVDPTSPSITSPIPFAPMMWTGTEYKLNIDPSFHIGSLGCNDLNQIFGGFKVAASLDSTGTLTADPNDVLNMVSQFPGSQILGLFQISACRGLKIVPPSLDCETNREYFTKIVGESPEDTILNAIPFLSSDLKNFLRPRFNVCTGFDTSGLTCKQIADLVPELANIISPGLGELLDNPVGKFLLEALACFDLHFPDISLPSIPAFDFQLPSFDFGGFNVNFGGCWFGCHHGGGGGGNLNLHWFTPQQGGGNATGSDLPCDVIPLDISIFSFGNIIQIAQDNGLSLVTTFSAFVGCRYPVWIPGFPHVTPPVITIVSPIDGQQVTSSTISVSGVVNDPSSQISVDGLSAPFVEGADGLHYSVMVPVPSNGVITAQAVDPVGNVGSAKVSIHTGPFVDTFAAGTNHFCAILDKFNGLNKVLRCFGLNFYGETDMDGLTEVTSVATGDFHTCVVTNGKVFCTGWNYWGQLGPNGGTQSANPIQVPYLPNDVTSVSGAPESNCALASEGIFCWGNIYGAFPVKIIDLSAKIDGLFSGGWGSCVLQNGGLLCWGRFLGLNPVSPGAFFDSGVTSVAISSDSLCAVSNGNLECIGNGSYSIPVGQPILTSGNVTLVGAGLTHICAAVNQSIQCWGNNNTYQAPTTVPNISGNFSEIGGGYLYTCALSNGQLYCWGGGGPSSEIPQLATF